VPAQDRVPDGRDTRVFSSPCTFITVMALTIKTYLGEDIRRFTAQPEELRVDVLLARIASLYSLHSTPVLRWKGT
jgi:hypothetical protein